MASFWCIAFLVSRVAAQRPGPSQSATCSNPTCSSPPCAAPLLGDVGCTTVSGVETYNHELLSAGHSIASNAHIYGPFEAGFTSQQQSIIENWGCSDASVAYDTEGGTDIGTAESKVSHVCNIQLPRIDTSTNTYYGVVGPCGGHTGDYHFHRSFSCLYSETGGHSTKVGVVAGHNIYGKWEDYENQMLPLLDACGAHVGPTPESTTPVYHYHAQDQAPFTVGCHGPSATGGLVSVATCRSLYSKCDNDGGSGTTIHLKTGSISYDKFCPCFDAAGSNMGTNIQELPALSTDAISYSSNSTSSSVVTVDSGATTSASTDLSGSVESAASSLSCLTCYALLLTATSDLFL